MQTRHHNARDCCLRLLAPTGLCMHAGESSQDVIIIEQDSTKIIKSIRILALVSLAACYCCSLLGSHEQSGTCLDREVVAGALGAACD